jgi:hypothetical protein
MNRSLAILFLLLALAAKPATAQTFFENREYGISLGGSQYFGDLNDDYGFSYIRPAGGAFMRIHMNPFIGIRIGGVYTKVGYDDKLSGNYFNKRRNLKFESDVVEATVQAEFNFFRFFTGEEHSRFTPYLTMGIGAFYYSPYTHFNGVKYYLRPMGTEGQNAGYGDRQYSNINLCYPIGAGFKYWLRPGLNFGFEIANRFTNTDYLDDVSATYVGIENFPSSGSKASAASQLQDRSYETGTPIGQAGKQRGVSSTKDQYLTFQFTLSFQLKTYKCPAYLREGFYNINQ